MTSIWYHFDLIQTPLSWGVLFLGIALYVIGRGRIWRSAWTGKVNAIKPLFKLPLLTSYQKPLQPHKSPEKHDPVYSEDAYHNIEPLTNFDLDKEEPLKLRPFKPIYHMTMALENTTLSDLIAMDNTYPSRCALRKSLIQTERHEVLACNPVAIPAVLELYVWLTSTYLPMRFPTLFTLGACELRNNVTGDILPLHLSETVQGAEDALRIMGENIDDEFLIMLRSPSATPSTPTQYRLEAFINCFPSGFNTRSKLNLLLSGIHAPVPGYAQKLEKSMDRFFAALPVGKIVKRANWSISTSGELFCLAGSHMSEEEMAAKEKEELGEEIDLEKTVVRCEKQTLHRLPKSEALVFAFKVSISQTYRKVC
jgi:hypothetical protein